MQMVPAFVVDGATLTQSVSLKERERERINFERENNWSWRYIDVNLKNKMLSLLVYNIWAIKKAGI